MSKNAKDPAGISGTLDKENNSVNVPNGWAAREGLCLVKGLQIGKVLGQGFQGVVHELVDTDGRRAPIVLKAAKPAALISDMEREWNAGVKVGRLAMPSGELPGLMKVGPALRNSQGKLVGQVLERINGKSVSKIISKKDFNDVWYLRSMLQQTFVALDAAQRAFGCDNIMEHTPSREDIAQDELSMFVMGNPENRTYERQFKIIDYGLTKFDDNYSMASGWVQQKVAAQNVHDDPLAEEKAIIQESVLRVQNSQKEADRVVGMEWLHKSAWRGKGDCYHILLDLSRTIYGRTWCASKGVQWPREDAVSVYLLMALINHTCSVVPQAFFTPRPQDTKTGETAADIVAEAVMNTKTEGFPKRLVIREEARTPLGRAWQGYLRWSLVRRAARDLKAWHFPSNSGLRASEALQSALFVDGLEMTRIVDVSPLTA